VTHQLTVAELTDNNDSFIVIRNILLLAVSGDVQGAADR
jgi:hypothetical protein